MRKGIWSEVYGDAAPEGGCLPPQPAARLRRDAGRSRQRRAGGADDARAFFRGELKTLDAICRRRSQGDGSRHAAAPRGHADADRTRARSGGAGDGRRRRARVRARRSTSSTSPWRRTRAGSTTRSDRAAAEAAVAPASGFQLQLGWFVQKAGARAGLFVFRRKAGSWELVADGVQRSVNVSSTFTTDGDRLACPCSVPGRKRHCRTAMIACWSRPKVESSERVISMRLGSTVPSGSHHRLHFDDALQLGAHRVAGVIRLHFSDELRRS